MKRHNHNSTELRPGDELRLKLANKEFTDEWTIIAAREAARLAAERNVIAEQIDDLGYFDTKLTRPDTLISPEQKMINDIKDDGSNVVDLRAKEIAYLNSERVAE